MYGAEPVVEVFAEFPLGHGLDHVEVGGSHDAHVGLQHGRRAHLEKLAALEHAKQAGLCGEGQFAHLVEEDGAAVGLLEISLAGRECAGEGSLFVTEEFGVDGAFGYGAAVDGYVFPVFAGTVGMDDLREELFAGTALAGDEHGQVDGSNLQRAGNGPYQARSIADDAEPLFGLLYVCGNHNC